MKPHIRDVASEGSGSRVTYLSERGIGAGLKERVRADQMVDN
jgi:hypothetical protein